MTGLCACEACSMLAQAFYTTFSHFPNLPVFTFLSHVACHANTMIKNRPPKWSGQHKPKCVQGQDYDIPRGVGVAGHGKEISIALLPVC